MWPTVRKLNQNFLDVFQAFNKRFKGGIPGYSIQLPVTKLSIGVIFIRHCPCAFLNAAAIESWTHTPGPSLPLRLAGRCGAEQQTAMQFRRTTVPTGWPETPQSSAETAKLGFYSRSRFTMHSTHLPLGESIRTELAFWAYIYICFHASHFDSWTKWQNFTNLGIVWMILWCDAWKSEYMKNTGMSVC
jgi:hypothetical protein